MRNNLVRFSNTITNILFPHKLPHFSQRKRFMQALKRGFPIFLYPDPFCNLSHQEVSHRCWLILLGSVRFWMRSIPPETEQQQQKKMYEFLTMFWYVCITILVFRHLCPSLVYLLVGGRDPFWIAWKKGEPEDRAKRWNVTQFAAWWLQSSSAQCANRTYNGLFVDQHTYWLLWC